MTRVDTAALLDLEAKATEGPWDVVGKDILDADGGLVCMVSDSYERGKAARARDKADRRLIADARNAIRPLITELEATRDASEREREFVARMRVACDRTRAVRGRDEVAVKTSDWHALMSLAEFARRSAPEKTA